MTTIAQNIYNDLSSEIEFPNQKSVVEDIEYLLDYARSDLSRFSDFLKWQYQMLHVLNVDPELLRKVVFLAIDKVECDSQQFHNLSFAKDNFDVLVSKPAFQGIQEVVSFHYSLFNGVDDFVTDVHKEKMVADGQYLLHFLRSTNVDTVERLKAFLVWNREVLEVLGIPKLSLLRFLVTISLFEQNLTEHSERIIRAVCVESNKIELTDNLINDISRYQILIFSEIDPFSKEVHLEKIMTDTEKHIAFLNQAKESDSIILFKEYMVWVNSTLNSLGIETISLIRYFGVFRMCFSAYDKSYLPFIDSALLYLTEEKIEENNEDVLNSQAQEYLQYLLKGNRTKATQFILDLVEKGESIKHVYIEIFQKSQYEIGRLWEKNKVSVAQEHFCTASTQMIMGMLYPKIFSDFKNDNTVIATCVGSELHELGVRMVADFLEMDGWNSYYIGANAPVQAIMDALEENDADLLAISVTLAPHAQRAKELITLVREKYPDLAIMVGGYPFIQDPELWRKIGADGYAKSAMDVNECALKLVSK